MRNSFAVTLRILRQFKHDPRTLFMMIVAPILALFLLNSIFGAPAYQPLVLLGDVPAGFEAALGDADARTESAGSDEALARLDEATADAYVTTEDGAARVWVEGSDPAKTGAALRAVAQAQAGALPAAVPPPAGLPRPLKVTYVHGSEDLGGFDYYGPVFIGVFIFFFVFVTSGISFLRERTGGTLERLLAMPIRRWELVLGYVQGFGLFTLVQSAIVVWASIYWVRFPNFGELWLVLLIALSMALVSLLLGILVSEFANTELQVMQLLQIIVIPQILLSGMLDLSQTPDWMQLLSRVFPVTYGADALRAVMLRGAGVADVWLDLAVLWAFVVVLFGANVIGLKRYRAI